MPYDCGLAIVRDPAALRAAMGMHGDYLIHDDAGDPFDKVPEISRRGRAFPVWAVLRALGRDGVADLVDGLLRPRGARSPRGSPRSRAREVLNDVVFTQVCASFGDDDRTRAVVAADARRRHGLDDRLALARPRGAAGLGEQLVDDRRRRRREPRRAAPRRRSLTASADGARLPTSSRLRTVG